MKKNRLMCVLLVLCLCIVCSCSQEPDLTKVNKIGIDLGFAGGDGSTQYPFLIATKGQLQAFRDSVNTGTTYEGKVVVLTNNIDLENENWIPIGDGTRGTVGPDDHYFMGTFDGNNHSISNLSVSLDLDNHGAGLFGAVKNATIKNVIVASGTVSNSEDAAAGIVAIILGDENSTVKNCVNYASINGSAVGGIVSRAYGTGDVTISDCHNYGNIIALTSGKAGGILCINNTQTRTTIHNCINEGVVKGGTGGTAGILAYANVNAIITGCTNKGEIGDLNSKYVGGIIGYASISNGSEMKDCLNEGKISASLEAGGLVGIVTNGAFSYTDNRNTAEVSGETAGGVVGSAYGSTDKGSGVLNGCSNTGTITGSKFAGGVAGQLGGTATIMNCSGGTSQVNVGTSGGNGSTIFYGYKGRLIGAIANGPDTWATLAVDDQNEDDYTDIGSIGIMAPGTAWALLNVTYGTIHGLPQVGGNTSKIKFAIGTSLDGNRFEVETEYSGGLNIPLAQIPTT